MWVPYCDRFISFCHRRVESKRGTIRRVKRYWEIIADNLSKAGWSWGCSSAIDSSGPNANVCTNRRWLRMAALKERLRKA